MVPQPFSIGGNRSYPELWVITGGPQYQGYKTPTLHFFKLLKNKTSSIGLRRHKRPLKILRNI
jgi:hypothetical protein